MRSLPTDSFNPQAEVWRFILERLQRRQRVALLLVADSKGHAPGKTGFKMAISADGRLCGTIGGGAIEHDAVEEARAILRQRHPRACVALKVHEPQHPQTSGMICGGQQVVVTYPCRAQDRPATEALLEGLALGTAGTLTLTARGLRVEASRAQTRSFRFSRSAASWRFTEHVPAPDTIYIIGGGHVGLALSRVMATLDFRVVVIDERSRLDTLAKNRFAHEKRVLPFGEVGRAIPEGRRSYAVIMTPGHRSDDAALRPLVRKRLRYLGVLGSPRKARQLLDQLRAEGCPPEYLARVRTPVGLPIASHTAAEIAISIAAEIIQVRNAGGRDEASPRSGGGR
jgi:xanthine dehydrogenase accessory factor